MRDFPRTALLGVVLVATTSLSTAWQEGPKDQARFHYQVARVALDRGDTRKARAELEKALALDPTNALIPYNLALITEKDDPAAALKHLNTAMSLGLPDAEKETAIAMRPGLAYFADKAKSDAERRKQWVGGWAGKLAYGGDKTCYAVYIVENESRGIDLSVSFYISSGDTIGRILFFEKRGEWSNLRKWCSSLDHDLSNVDTLRQCGGNVDFKLGATDTINVTGDYFGTLKKAPTGKKPKC